MRPQTSPIRELLTRLGARQPERRALRCENCDIPIEGEPVRRELRGAGGGADVAAYCCEGCGEGGPCTC